MSGIIVEIMVEVLTILAITTKEVKRGRISESMWRCIIAILADRHLEKYFKKLTGNREIEDSLERLDKLTQEEARMASAEQLKMMHSVDGKVTGVDDRVRGVEGQVQDVRDDVQDVRSNVQDVGNKVQDVDNRMQGIDNSVRGVDDKLDQSSRSLSFKPWSSFCGLRQVIQGTSSEIIFYDGFRRQTHPQIITLHAKPITTAQLNGFSKEVYSIDGNRLAPSCAYLENVCYSWSLPCDDP